MLAACGSTAPKALIPTPSPPLPAPSWRWASDPKNGYDIAIPPGWEFALRDSSTLDADVGGIRTRYPEAGAYLAGAINGVNSLPDLKLLAIDPVSTSAHYVTHVSVIRVDLAGAGRAASLDTIGKAELDQAAHVEGLQGAPAGTRLKIGPGDAYQLTYSVTLADGALAKTTSYFFITTIGTTVYEFEVATASRTPDWADPLMRRMVESLRFTSRNPLVAQARLR